MGRKEFNEKFLKMVPETCDVLTAALQACVAVGSKEISLSRHFRLRFLCNYIERSQKAMDSEVISPPPGVGGPGGEAPW
jgi:hypothetical protein